VLSISGQIVDGTIPFTSSSSIALGYTGQTDNLANDSVPLASAANSSGPNGWFSIPVTSSSVSYPRTSVAGVGISAFDGTDDPSGAINANARNNGGAGWTNGDTFTVDGGLSGFLAAGTVTNAIAGVIQVGGYTLSANGAGYVPATGVTLTSTACAVTCTGASIDITTITPANGTVTLYIRYGVDVLP
jgi:hypothetical protein